MTNFARNNLHLARSPYLKQHKDNPVHWQEWTPEVLDHARESGKLILVSIGYSTCHWCHVMAAEAFSDEGVAEILNDNFVAIKVDREERPEIDQYFIEFVTHLQGTAGWPLNVILTPDLKPFFGGTYFPVDPRADMPGFKQVLVQVLDWHKDHKDTVTLFNPPPPAESRDTGTVELLAHSLLKGFDPTWGGFGRAAKFPPHSSLLFLLNYSAAKPDMALQHNLTQTLDAMASRGLHDHLQGGFYRYCIERTWTIPHFEKMLYDQAMMLWVYSSAYKLFGKEGYKTIVEKLITCLSETFEHDGLYFAAHDADTEHEEGATYVWSYAELKDAFSAEELTRFSMVYELPKEGNFERKIHLLKKQVAFLPGLERKLLEVRKARPQPFIDRKIVTSWNALAGIGLLMAHRHAGIEGAGDKARTILARLLAEHFNGTDFIAHSSVDGEKQKQMFLEDVASVLLLATYLHEESDDQRNLIAQLLRILETFRRDGQWFESVGAEDFYDVPARAQDHPTPSSVSLAEMALLRAGLILGLDMEPMTAKKPYEADFYNLATIFSAGFLHVTHAPQPLDWAALPLNVLQLVGEAYEDCYENLCRRFENEADLLKSLKA